MSGCTESLEVALNLPIVRAILAKPFTLEQLRDAVATARDRPAIVGPAKTPTVPARLRPGLSAMADRWRAR